MRRTWAIVGLFVVVCMTILINSLFTLISLLFEDCTADAIKSIEIPAPNSSLIDQRPQLIPKIIHQTWKNETVPDVWAAAQRSCVDLHPDYEYILWTDEKSREFIRAEYPWFLAQFDAYPYPIQRADVIRYFILNHFGGIYIDLDDGCQRRLDPLLSYHAWLRKTVPTGISNDAMGSVPGHPFFATVISSLTAYARNWKLPYLTVMFSTGPLFLSVIWKEYIRGGSHASESERIRILMPQEYKSQPWSFFVNYAGSSWHRGDAHFVFWMGEHWLFLVFLGFFLAALVAFLVYVLHRSVRVYVRQARYRHAQRNGHDGAARDGGWDGGYAALAQREIKSELA